MIRSNGIRFIVVAVCAIATPAMADVVELSASKDNTLFEDSNGSVSNGAGQYFFVGKTAFGVIRRGAISFDVASAVPPGSTIDNVSLSLHMSKTLAAAVDVNLHRALADWGEGASAAGGEEGSGTLAEPGDATWLHTFSPTDFWAKAGGDFEAVASAGTSVEEIGSYVWSSSQMAADVQLWLDQPSSDAGWILVGDESASVTTKRFDTKDHTNGTVHPVLTIEFTVGSGDGVPASSDTSLAVTALLLLVLGSAVVLGRRSRTAE